MEIIDWFKGQAIEGIISGMQDNMNEKDIAKRATSMAKEMILERKSPNEIRDSFAGKAMTGLLSGSTLDDKDVPKEAYEIADEILK